MTNGIENAKKDSFRCQEGSYVNRIVFVMASKLRKNCSFDAKFFLRVHRRRKTGVPVHIGWHRKCQKRQFSMPFSILNYFSGLWARQKRPGGSRRRLLRTECSLLHPKIRTGDAQGTAGVLYSFMLHCSDPAWSLRQLRFSGVELVVAAAELQKVVMSAALYDLAFFQHHDGVGIADGG